MIEEFITAIVNPDKIIEKIDKTKNVSKTALKLALGISLTIMSSMIAFIGVIILELYFLYIGRISFSISLVLDPIYASMVIPIIFWLFDTIILIIGIELVREEPNLYGLLNLRALSIVPIPLKILYVYYKYTSLSISLLFTIPQDIVSIGITLWSIILLTRGVSKYFGISYKKAIIPGILPFLIKIIIAFLI